MVMKLDQVVPFGRSLDEYRNMFNLSEADMHGKIVAVADGPASFNAEMKKLGNNVVSIDPLYCHTADDIKKRFYHVVDDIIDQVRKTQDDWVWDYHGSAEQLREHRIRVLETFCADFNAGKTQGRYITGELPALDVADQEYDLALCSHFLFLYSDQFDYNFHRRASMEMLRIAKTIRIYPLLTLNLERSPHVDKLLQEFAGSQYDIRMEKVSYEFQRGAGEMLTITRR